MRLVEIASLNPRELEPLLLEEAAEWKTELDWDFSAIAALIRRLARERRLAGVAIAEGAEIAGCGCLAVASKKGMVVDAYVRKRWRGGDVEMRLFRTLFGALAATAEVRRVEAQLMLFSAHHVPGAIDRLLLRRSLAAPLPARKAVTGKFRIEPWTDCCLEAAAGVVARAHHGQVDCEISDCYDTEHNTVALLRNIIECGAGGRFCEPASFVAFDKTTGRLVGVLLASFVAEGAGHLSELCISPEAQGGGLGYDLLCRSLEALEGFGADRASLAVTGENKRAVEFYTRCGFREYRRFPAFAWDRPITFPIISPTSESRNKTALSPSPDS